MQDSGGVHRTPETGDAGVTEVQPELEVRPRSICVHASKMTTHHNGVAPALAMNDNAYAWQGALT